MGFQLKFTNLSNIKQYVSYIYLLDDFVTYTWVKHCCCETYGLNILKGGKGGRFKKSEWGVLLVRIYVTNDPRISNAGAANA